MNRTALQITVTLLGIALVSGLSALIRPARFPKAQRWSKGVQYAALAMLSVALGAWWYTDGNANVLLGSLRGCFAVLAWALLVPCGIPRTYFHSSLPDFLSTAAAFVLLLAALQAPAGASVPQSPWLVWHVSSCLGGYAALIAASLLAVVHLCGEGWSNGAFPGAQTLEKRIRQAIACGLFMLAIGMASGSFWAKDAWGAYWSWDPKEIWCLTVWSFYAAILGTGQRGKTLALLTLFGLGVLLFCWLGVNRLAASLHSYG